MQRKDMAGHTVYLYEANNRCMPVLILEPRTEVTAKERYSTFNSRGEPLQVGYIRGDAPKTPGMLAIQWIAADTIDEAARRLEDLKDLHQSVITDSVGSRILPRGAVAIVVWPKNIVSTWADHIRPKPPRTTPEEIDAAREAHDRRTAREQRIVTIVTQALNARGAENASVEAYIDNWDEAAPPQLDVLAYISGKQLLRLLGLELPADLADLEIV